MEELARDPASRRRFLKGVGGAGAASFAVFLSACGSKKTKPTPGGSNPNTAAGVGTDQFGKGDLGIATFALTLEYLEADFYRTGLKHLSGDARTMAKLFGEQEAEHVAALRQTITKLGGKPAAKPTFEFGVTDQKSFLKLARTLEDTGVSAYNGAAPSIKSKEVLAAAGSIVQVEARHAAVIRQLTGAQPAPNAFDPALDKDAVLKAVQPLIA